MGTTNTLDLNNRINELSDSVTSVEEALAEKITQRKLTITANSSITQQISGGFRGYLITSSVSGDTTMGLYILATNSGGTALIKRDVAGASKLALAYSNGVLTISNADANTILGSLVQF